MFFVINLAIAYRTEGIHMKLFTVLLILVNLIPAWSQSTRPHNTYYYQKKALFELLPNDSDEIIFLGNSITDGCEWHELFNDPRIKNRGISADVTGGVLDRLDEVVESKPLQIFLMIGINDLARGDSLDYILANYRQIIQLIKEKTPASELYIQSVLPVNDSFNQFKNHVNKTDQVINLNARLEQLSGEQQVTFIDLYSKFTTPEGKLDPEYTNDGLHLTGKGYLHWKALVTKYVLPQK